MRRGCIFFLQRLKCFYDYKLEEHTEAGDNFVWCLSFAHLILYGPHRSVMKPPGPNKRRDYISQVLAPCVACGHLPSLAGQCILDISIQQVATLGLKCNGSISKAGNHCLEPGVRSEP